METEVPFFRAMAERVSPLATVYLEPEDFLVVVFLAGDFFFAELVEAVDFFGVEDEMEGVVFFVPLKA